jgi:hypothetical protein
MDDIKVSCSLYYNFPASTYSISASCVYIGYSFGMGCIELCMDDEGKDACRIEAVENNYKIKIQIILYSLRSLIFSSVPHWLSCYRRSLIQDRGCLREEKGIYYYEMARDIIAWSATDVVLGGCSRLPLPHDKVQMGVWLGVQATNLLRPQTIHNHNISGNI